MSFHQRLKHERLVKGWTIEQLSQASGVTVNRIALLERNLVEMVSDSLKAQLAKALEVDFQAPPSVPVGAVAEPAAAPVVVTPLPVLPAAPEPLALHLSAPLQQQLEAAARIHGRSLHGEVLARLEASLFVVATAPAPATSMVPEVVAPQLQSETRHVIALSEADLEHITAQVALRLQSRR